MAFTTSLDTSTPAGTETPTLGDDRIRASKSALVERLAQDHDMTASGTTYDDDTTVGFHKRLTLLNRSSNEAALANAIRLFPKDDADPTAESELFSRHETDGVVQITSKGGPRVVLNSLTNKDAATIAAFDVVVRNHSSTAKSFKGSTTAEDLTVLGINQASAAADATGSVVFCGRTPVNMKTADAGGKGSWIMQSDTKGKCKSSSVFIPGVFGQLQSDIASDVAIAEIFPVVRDLALTSEAQGDIWYRGASVRERLEAGTSGQFLKTLGAAANPLWADVVDALGTAISTLKIRAARFTGGASPTLQKGIGGTHTAVQTAAGRYTVTWAGTAFADANYIALAMSYTGAGDDSLAQGVSKTTSTTLLRMNTSSGTNADPEYFEVIAIGT